MNIKYDNIEMASYALRLPKELKEHIETLARKDKRSLNAEIIYLLELVAGKLADLEDRSDLEER